MKSNSFPPIRSSAPTFSRISKKKNLFQFYDQKIFLIQKQLTINKKKVMTLSGIWTQDFSPITFIFMIKKIF